MTHTLPPIAPGISNSQSALQQRLNMQHLEKLKIRRAEIRQVSLRDPMPFFARGDIANA